ncbi:MAG: hypothetical protein RH917_08840 [Lacipirellulaceae bacterium]
MPPERLLVWFCWVYMFVLGVAILLPYLRRKSDLLTTWNFMLLSLINFIGISGLTAGYWPELFRVKEFERRDYMDYMVGAIVFTVFLFLFYYKLNFAAKLANRRFRKWPPQSPATLFCMVAIACLMGLAVLFPLNIQGIGQVIFQVGGKGSIFAFAFAFVAWWKQRKNPFLLSILLGTFFYAVLLAIVVGGGRRNMVGVLSVVPIALYWLTLRNRTPRYALMVLGITGFCGMAVIAAYSEIRHFSRIDIKNVAAEDRSASSSLAALKEIPKRLMSSSTDHFLGQNCAQLSLTAIHIYRNEVETKPFNALKFVLLTPIPRAIWEDKPIGLGFELPKDAKANTRATWGPGIVGHGYHEGGLHMLVFYAFLTAFALRFVDQLLITQPNNSYLIAFLAAASGHLIGWARGDISTFTNQIIFCFLAMLVLAYSGRFLFGRSRLQPHLAQAPGRILRSKPSRAN